MAWSRQATKIILKGWWKAYQSMAFWTIFWHSTTQSPDTKPPKHSTSSKDPLKSLGNSPSCVPCMVSVHTTITSSTSPTRTGTVNVAMWPPNPDAMWEHILHLCPLFADECREFLTPVSRLHKTLTLLGSNKGPLASVGPKSKGFGYVTVMDVSHACHAEELQRLQAKTAFSAIFCALVTLISTMWLLAILWCYFHKGKRQNAALIVLDVSSITQVYWWHRRQMWKWIHQQN